MQIAQDKRPKMLHPLLDAIGGEPLAGSGFEAENPDEGFTITEEAEEE